MNRLEVQEVYDRLNSVHDIWIVKNLGFKFCLFNDIFGKCSVDTMSDVDAYIEVRRKLLGLCEHALNMSYTPVTYDCNGRGIFIGSKVWCSGNEFTVRGYKQEFGTEYLYCADNDFNRPAWLTFDDTITVGRPKTKEEVLRDIRDALMVALDNLKKETIASLEKTVESLREAQKD